MPRWPSVRSVPPIVIDGVLAVLFTVVAQVELHLDWDDGYKAGPLWLNSPLQAMFTMTLLLRTSRPRLTLALMGVVMAGPSLFVGHTLLFFGNFLPLMLVNYTVARTERGGSGDGRGWCARRSGCRRRSTFPRCDV